MDGTGLKLNNCFYIIMKKGSIVLAFSLFKIIIWFLFQDYIISISNYFCELFQIVPIGKQYFITGLSKINTIIKISFILVELAINLLIYILFFNITDDMKKFILKYIIISLFLVVVLCFLF